jgi:N-acetylmuramoyl-L-alanine amidase
MNMSRPAIGDKIRLLRRSPLLAWKGIVNRSFKPAEFADYVAGLNFSLWRPQFVVLHNTAAPTLAEWHNVPGSRRMLNLEKFYRDVQHWSAGPHLFIADDLIWAFTPLTTPGVHSPSWNAISWGVEMVGDYATEPFNPGVMANTVAALSTLYAALGKDPATLKLHKDDPRTTHVCPGKNVRKAHMIDLVQTELAVLHPGEHAMGAFAG